MNHAGKFGVLIMYVLIIIKSRCCVSVSAYLEPLKLMIQEICATKRLVCCTRPNIKWWTQHMHRVLELVDSDITISCIQHGEGPHPRYRDTGGGTEGYNDDGKWLMCVLLRKTSRGQSLVISNPFVCKWSAPLHGRISTTQPVAAPRNVRVIFKKLIEYSVEQEPELESKKSVFIYKYVSSCPCNKLAPWKLESEQCLSRNSRWWVQTWTRVYLTAPNWTYPVTDSARERCS